MQLTSKELRAALGLTYPNAALHLLDRKYHIPSVEECRKHLKKFYRRTSVYGLVRWLPGKLDCDKWAWLFKAYCIFRNALTRRKDSLAVGFMCFHIDADPLYGHAINFVVANVAGEPQVFEIDAEPNKGFIDLTEAEKSTVWLIIL